MASDEIAFLASTDLLADVPPRLLHEIRRDLVEVRLEAGATLFRQGDEGDAVYLIRQGSIRIETDGYPVANCLAGQWLGEIALVDQGPRSGEAIAAVDVLLLRWDRSRFQALLRRDPRVAPGLFRVLSAKIRRATEKQVRLESEGERLRQDLRRAREIQEGMLPRGPLRTPNLDIAGYCRPAAEVGGDYFDYLTLPGDRYAVIIGDVTGHGFYSGLFVAMAKSCLFTQVKSDDSPAAVMTAMADAVGLSIKPGLLMTCCYLVIDPPAECLVYANAGHPHPCLLRASGDGFDQLEVLDPLLGVQDLYTSAFREFRCPWYPGDLLVLYSDGVTEVCDDGGTALGSAGLLALVQRYRHESSETICAAVRAQIDAVQGGRPQSDDQSLVIVRAAGP